MLSRLYIVSFFSFFWEGKKKIKAQVFTALIFLGMLSDRNGSGQVHGIALHSIAGVLFHFRLLSPRGIFFEKLCFIYTCLLSLFEKEREGKRERVRHTETAIS